MYSITDLEKFKNFAADLLSGCMGEDIFIHVKPDELMRIIKDALIEKDGEFWLAGEKHLAEVYSRINDAVVSNSLMSLINKGLVDLTVGDDGEFYFKTTEKGKEVVKETESYNSKDEP